MLPAHHRMRRGQDFTATVRKGVRAGTDRLVVHRRPTADEDAVLVGFVVSKGVGGAVVRTRVKRRLRHLMSERLASIERGTHVVVRALPRAAQATSAQLGADLDRALRSTARKLERRRPPAASRGSESSAPRASAAPSPATDG
ncbi:ribonuclease P protein component [Georgenia sp. Z1491]|uniref:ribonuclease P protein component n=1 Tax=Georgenia sp. Z1491 TaxID=3416707 RepID=UPI003CE969C4